MDFPKIITVSDSASRYTRPPRPLKYLFFLTALLVVGAALRIHDLGVESFWQDEVTMASITGDTDKVIEEIVQNRPPVFVILGYLWVHIFGTSELAARSLPMFIGILSIAMAFLVGRELYDIRVGLITAFFMTFAGQQIYHSQDYRYYATLVLFTLLSFFFLTRALRSGRSADFVLYIVSSVLVIYTHSHGVFVLLAQGLAFATLSWKSKYEHIEGSTRSRWLASQLLIAVIALPSLARRILPANGQAEGMGLDWLKTPALDAPLDYVLAFLFYGWETASIIIGFILFFAVLVIYINRIGFQNWHQEIARVVSTTHSFLHQHRNQLLITGFWFVIPIAVPFILSFLVAPMYTFRYVMPASIGFYLLLSVTISLLRRVIPIYLLLAVYLAVSAPAFIGHYYEGVSKEQWRESANYVENLEAEGDLIVIPTFDRATGYTEVDAFKWYYQGNIPICQMIYERIQEPDVARSFAECSASPRRIWLIVFRDPNFPATIGDLTNYYASASTPYLATATSADFEFISIYLFQLQDTGCFCPSHG
jgi:mannosyltransferase